MNGFRRAFAAEWFKITRRTKYKVFFLILSVLYAGAVLLSVKLSGGAQRGIALEGLILNIYMPLVMFLGANDLIAGEIRTHSIHMAVSAPFSRTQLFLAKFLAVFLNAAAPAVIICVIDTGLAVFGRSLGDGHQLFYLLIDLVPAAALAAFACCVPLVIPGSALSMLICICVYIVLRLTGIFAGFSAALFTSYSAWHPLFLGGMRFISLLARILAIVSPLAFFLSAGCCMMERKRF